MALSLRSLWSQVRQSLSGQSPRRRSANPVVFLEQLEKRVVLAAAKGSVIVTPDLDFITSEEGGETQLTVVLSAAPTKAKKSVVVTVSSNDPSEGVTSNATLVFNTQNWNVPQTVTVTGVDDAEFDGDTPYDLVFSVNSKSKNYKKVKASPVSLTNLDDESPPEPPALIISDTSLEIDEGTSTDVFFNLTSAPAVDVNVVFTVTSGQTQAQLSSSTLTFTPANFAIPQKVSIGAFTGDGQDGNQPFAFTVDIVSADPAYDALPQEQVSATIIDKDLPGVALDGNYEGTFAGVIAFSGAATPVSGPVAFGVAGDALSVTVPASGVGSIVGATATFTQTSGILSGATFTGTFTANPDGSIRAAGTWVVNASGATGSGTWSATLPAPAAAGIQFTPAADIAVNEGSQQAVSIVLLSRPTRDVTLALVSQTGTDQASLSKSSMVFTPANWNEPQVVVINGVAGDGNDGDQPFSFRVVPSSDDANYAAINPKTISATIKDTDAPAVTNDGNYVGTFTGTLTTLGIPAPVNSPLAFTISGETVTITQPVSGSGTITGNTGTFTLPGNQATFTGSLVQNPDGSVTASGTWQVATGPISGSGIWTAIRPPLS